MRFTTTTLVLLNAYLSAALPRLPIPNLPNAPDAPSLPNTPDLLNPNTNTPGQPVNEPGRWPPENQNPNAPGSAEPGRWVDQPQQQPDLPACDGKKRMECTPSDAEWTRLDVPGKFQGPGKEAIDRLDKVKEEPPQPPNAPTKETMNAKYNVIGQPNQAGGNSNIMRLVKGFDDEKNDWYEFVIKNKDENIDRFINGEKGEIDQDPNLTPEEKAIKNTDLDQLRTELKASSMLGHWSSVERKTLVLDFSYNRKFDLYRNYIKGPQHDEMFLRIGLDQKEAVGFTDQVMYGWKQACEAARRNPKDVELENIVRRSIETDETNQVIEAAMQKAGKKFGSDGDIIEFKKGEEGFDAIMGTIHGKRVAQMLTDYHDVVGDRTISKFTIMRGEEADDLSDMDSDDVQTQVHDMLISVEKIA